MAMKLQDAKGLQPNDVIAAAPDGVKYVVDSITQENGAFIIITHEQAGVQQETWFSEQHLHALTHTGERVEPAEKKAKKAKKAEAAPAGEAQPPADLGKLADEISKPAASEEPPAENPAPPVPPVPGA